MQLLVFAHRAEAQTFLKLGNFKSVETTGNDLFFNSESYLLICGEGTMAALEMVSASLGLLKGKVTSVLNFGVAGSLSKKVIVDEIYEVRTAYAEIGSQIEFKSYSTKSTSLLDCISASNRVVNSEYAQHLSCFAQIVDREYWAIARAASNFTITFKAYKLISDNALENNSDEPICELVKTNSEYYSDRLYKHYKSLNSEVTNVEEKRLIDSYKDLYFTVSQYRQYRTVLKSLLSKYESEDEILKRVGMSIILEMEVLPKQKSQMVLEKMRELLTPFNTILNGKINTVLSPLKRANIQVKLSKNLESSMFNINASIRSESDLLQISTALSKFDFEQYQKLLKGDFNV
ncbi:hypothetical protein A9Q84_10600 [Halobacteriovorax marinus]|uniref:Nucleoside phosphorylase domain-containing protein n=1 Tax=Halobacteriovorax marinus TaxID=97084 RepID=A0A1Y5FDW1_9BACT|nr:hypothetical protein A9Q84_10600 [Halobacteriovorax marinus]